MSDSVLDASVVVSLYLPATPAQRAYASKVVGLLYNGAVAAVPGLFAEEIGSVMIKARRKRLINAAVLDGVLADLDAVFLEIHHQSGLSEPWFDSARNDCKWPNA